MALSSDAVCRHAYHKTGSTCMPRDALLTLQHATSLLLAHNLPRKLRQELLAVGMRRKLHHRKSHSPAPL